MANRYYPTTEEYLFALAAMAEGARLASQHLWSAAGA